MKNEIIIFEEENIKLEVNLNDETVWLTQTQLLELFQKSKKTIRTYRKHSQTWRIRRNFII